jgi:hypothetical protein
MLNLSGCVNEIGKIDIPRTVKLISESGPFDVFMVQESLISKDVTVGRQLDVLADALEMPHKTGFPFSECHFWPNAEMEVGILSRHPFVSEPKVSHFPVFDLTKISSNGTAMWLHPKGMIDVLVDVGRQHVRIASGHNHPLHRFDVEHDDDEFKSLYQSIDRRISHLASNAPLIAGIDLNTPMVDRLLPKSCENCDVLGGNPESRTSDGDFLFFSGVGPSNMRKVETKGDHLLFAVEVELAPAFERPSSRVRGIA